MITENMVKPSFWVDKGVKITRIRNINLFKFTDELQQRLEELAEKNKRASITDQETAELAGILELNQIFTLLNAKIISEG